MLSAPAYAQTDCDTGVTNTDACHTTQVELTSIVLLATDHHNNVVVTHGGPDSHTTKAELEAAVASSTGGAAVTAHDGNAAAHGGADSHTTKSELDAVIASAGSSADLADAREEMSAGIAMAMAMQAPPVTPGKKMNLTIGAGFYNHETALAISAGARVNENWTLSGSIGYVAYGDDESDAGGRVAATFEF